MDASANNVLNNIRIQTILEKYLQTVDDEKVILMVGINENQ